MLTEEIEAQNLRPGDIIRILGTEVIVSSVRQIHTTGKFMIVYGDETEGTQGWIVPAERWIRVYGRKELHD